MPPARSGRRAAAFALALLGLGIACTGLGPGRAACAALARPLTPVLLLALPAAALVAVIRGGRALPILAHVAVLGALLGAVVRFGGDPELDPETARRRASILLGAGLAILGWALHPAVTLPARAQRVGAVALVAAVLAGLLALFLVRFPPASWGEWIIQDDYGLVHYNSIREWESLKAGGLSGWEEAVEGGRPLHLNARTLLPLYAPFHALLGPKAALHALTLLLYLAVPLLAAWWARDVDPRATLPAFLVGSVLAASMFTNVLLWGMLYSLAAADLLILELILVRRVARGGRLAAVGLGVALAIAAMVHALAFLLTIPALVTGALLFTSGSRRRLLPLAGAAALGALVALPYFLPLLRDLRYLSPIYLTGGEHPWFASVWEVPLLQGLARAYDALLWSHPTYAGPIFHLLPLLLLPLRTPLGRAGLPLLTLVALIAAIVVPRLGYSVIRLDYLLPVTLAALIPAAARAAAEWGVRSVGPTALLVLLAWFGPGLMGTGRFLHTPAVGALLPGLVAAVRGADGYRVLVENSTGVDPSLAGQGVGEVSPLPHAHLEGLLALETGRRLFAHPGWDPNPYHAFRDVYFANGLFRGLPLAQYRVSEVAEELRRWGVRRLAVWSEGAKGLFAREAHRFPEVGREGPYVILDARDAEPSAVAVERGTAEIVEDGFFRRRVRLSGMRAGDTVRMKSHYHPGWRARTGGSPVPLYDVGGQLAFQAPGAGEHEVTLELPTGRGAALACLAAAAAVAVGLVAFPRRAQVAG